MQTSFWSWAATPLKTIPSVSALSWRPSCSERRSSSLSIRVSTERRQFPTATFPSAPARDIAFLGGLIHYALTHNAYQREYVKAHTNASFLIKEGFAFADGLLLRLGRHEESLRQIELGL